MIFKQSSFLTRKALTLSVRAFFIFTLAIVGCQTAPVKLIPAVAKPKPKPAPQFVVSFLGDVILHERLRKREEKTHEGFAKIWSDIQPYIDNSDITYANLEGPVAPEIGGITGFPRFNYPEQIISELKQSGFDIVSTANNHALDRYAKGVKKTIENLKKYDLTFTGTVTSEKDAADGLETWWGLTPLKSTQLNLAWIACAEMTNGNVDQEELVLYCYKDKEIIRALIQQLQARTDIAGIILTPHWGEEEKFEVARGRELWAHEMIDLGVTAIVGSHPHVIQKIEDYISADGRRTFVAYSMGNFVSNQPWIPTKASMMLFSKFKLNAQKKLEVVDVKALPLWMDRTVEKDATSKFRVVPVYDFAPKPAQAVKIWREQLGEKYLIRAPTELDHFLKK